MPFSSIHLVVCISVDRITLKDTGCYYVFASINNFAVNIYLPIFVWTVPSVPLILGIDLLVQIIAIIFKLFCFILFCVSKTRSFCLEQANLELYGCTSASDF